MVLIHSRYLHEWYEKNGLSKEKELYSFIGEDGTIVETINFAKLDAVAINIAAFLLQNPQHALKPGDVVMLMFPPGLFFVTTFVQFVEVTALFTQSRILFQSQRNRVDRL